ncbi:MAG: flagellar hook-length control protein FliK, partial [Gammaproteobacteria bacterium]
TAVARDAVESSLPRLRELFESSGVPLLDVNVSQQQRQGQRPQDGPLAAPPVVRDRLAAAGQGASDVPRRRTVGLVDAYA